MVYILLHCMDTLDNNKSIVLTKSSFELSLPIRTTKNYRIELI